MSANYSDSQSDTYNTSSKVHVNCNKLSTNVTKYCDLIKDCGWIISQRSTWISIRSCLTLQAADFNINIASLHDNCCKLLETLKWMELQWWLLSNPWMLGYVGWDVTQSSTPQTINLNRLYHTNGKCRIVNNILIQTSALISYSFFYNLIRSIIH
jgi:hypothetical protein